MPIQTKIKERLKDKITNWQERSPRRIYISIKPEDLKEISEYLFKEQNFRLVTCSGTDTPKGIEILYHFSFDKTGQIISVRVLLEDKKKPRIQSLANLTKGAEWIEREIWELLGVDFIGHPNLKHLLLMDEWPEGNFPLRKDKG